MFYTTRLAKRNGTNWYGPRSRQIQRTEIHFPVAHSAGVETSLDIVDTYDRLPPKPSQLPGLLKARPTANREHLEFGESRPPVATSDFSRKTIDKIHVKDTIREHFQTTTDFWGDPRACNQIALLLSCSLALLLSCGSVNAQLTSLSIEKGSNVRKIEAAFLKSNDEVECRVGELFNSSDYKIEIALSNNTGSTFEASDIKTSCGCIAKITESVKIERQATGTIFAVFTTPHSSEEFEKIIVIKNVIGDELKLRLMGKSVSRLEFTQSKLIVPQRVETSEGHFIDVKSLVGDDLSRMDWSIECPYPSKVVCTKSEKTETFRLGLTFNLAQLSGNDASTFFILKANTSDGKLYAQRYFQLHFAFNAATSPQRLVLKRIGTSDEFGGTFVVRKADFLADEVVESTKTLVLQFGDSHRLPVEADVKRTKNSSFIVRVRFSLDRECRKESFQEGRLLLDDGHSDFHIPVLFQ